ncbi:MAG: DUF1015 domain-containing protein [Cyclobacteriaceae bacterium]
MAEIKPIRGWRYNPSLSQHISSLTAPLFDVVSDKQRQQLYSNELNSIHLTVPKESSSSPKSAARTLVNWKEKGVLKQDRVPGIYVYYQHFTLPGGTATYCRKGFVINIRVYDWDENVILRHENTMPFSVNDRLEILNEMEMNVSPTHGLFTDPSREIEKYLDESMKSPVYDTENYQGVRDVMSVIHDVRVIKRIQTLIKDKQIILADGHHRYAGALQYMKDCREKNPSHSGQEAYNYHMMYLTNTESDDLRILPTHRLVGNWDGFSKTDLLVRLREDFDISPISNSTDTYDIIQGKKWTFGLLIEDEAYRISLKNNRIKDIPWKFSNKIKELDLTIMHYFVFEKILGIKGKDQTKSRKITFERNFTECIKTVITGSAQFALITNDISIEQVKETCYSGYTMPQKSTYFYPKVISGFVFSSINQNEFSSPFDPCFQ